METQESICKWADETFGEAKSSFRLVARANEELSELIRAISQEQNSSKISEEVADVYIVLTRFAVRINFNNDIFAPSNSSLKNNNIATVAVTQANVFMGEILLHLGEFDEENIDKDHCYEYLELIYYWLVNISKIFKFDVVEAINSKMQVNRNRKWVFDGDGHGYHVREGNLTGVED